MAAPTKKVNSKVTNLALKREGNSVKATWKIPSAMKKESDAHHAEFVQCELDFDPQVNGKTAKDKKAGEVWYGSASHRKGMSYDGYDDVTIKGLDMSTSVEKSYDRSRFHPVDSGRYCPAVKAIVRGGNTPGEWKSDSTGWWWVRSDGSMPKNQWEYIGKKWYYFRSSGYMATGSVTWDGETYTLANDGHLTSSSLAGSWEKSGTRWKFKKSGGTYLASKWGYIGGQWYWFDSNGYMATGTRTVNGASCKFASDGHYIPPSGEMLGPATNATAKYQKPDAPEVSVSYDQATAKATVKVKTDAGKGWKERYDTAVRVVVVKANGKEDVRLDWASTKSTDYSYSVDLSAEIASLAPGKTVTVKAYAVARGMAGNNPSKKKAKAKSLSIGIPVAAVIGGVSSDRKDAGGTVTVKLTPGANTASVQLQRSHNGDETTPSWSDVSGATDNGNAEALFDSYAEASPSPGTRTWYRIKSENYNFTTYSAPFEAKELFIEKPETVCAGSMRVCHAASDTSGENAMVVLGYTDSTDGSIGCELTYSDYENAWNSVDPPTPHLLPDSEYRDQTKAATAGAYAHSTTTYITGLTVGKTYYVRMRRYRVEDGDNVYSRYSETAKFVAQANPASSQLAILPIEIEGGVAKVVVGYTDTTPYDGTEISWAQTKDAWQSNAQPETMNATWRDPSSAAQGWSNSQTVWLRGLEPGTWYVRARRYLGDTFTDYTDARPFDIPTASEAADVRCGLVSVENGTDGTSLIAVVGWDGDHTGCEVSWSADPDAWKSSEEPDSFEFEWSDAESASSDWSHTSTCVIKGLEEGVTCYVRARSYFDAEDRAWSDYTAAMGETPYGAPLSVALDAPSTVAQGDPIELWWSVESEQEQTEWSVHRSGYPATSLESGGGSLCHATIPPEKYAGLGSITLYVEAGCGGGLTRSNAVTVGIFPVPSCEIACDPVLGAQPASFEAYSSVDGAMLLATCYSQGTTLAAPDGDRDQLEGTSVWTESLSPEWQQATWGSTLLRSQLDSAAQGAEEARDALEGSVTGGAAFVSAREALNALEPGDSGYDAALAAYDAAYASLVQQDGGDDLAAAQFALEDAEAALSAHPSSGAVYMAQVALPLCDLLDGGGYEIRATAVGRESGLRSVEASAEFGVAYAHQAPDPSDSIAIYPNEDSRSVDISLSAPEDAEDTDVYEIYRRTPSGYELIASNLPLDATVTDLFAPYGKDDLAYRIAVRTADGDVAYADFPYALDARVLRFDWDGGYAEFPWNVRVQRRAQKKYVSRAHAEGTVNGYWDRPVEVSGSYSTDIVKVADSALLRLAYQVGSYPGAVWVRDGYGFAMQCNVELSGVDIDNRQAAVPLSFSISAMRTTAQFMPAEEG